MINVLFPFIGGMGLFLIGMMLLSRGLIAFSGQTLRKVLIRFTGTPLKAYGSGAVMTAMMQSSTATAVTLIGFVSAGLVSFNHAIGVVMGASLGNTVASWVVSGIALKINLSFYTLPLIGLGALCKLLSKGRTADLGMSLAGFGIMFLGLRTLQDSLGSLTGHFDLATLPMGGLGAHLIIMLIGFAMTAILQSSTAAIATTLTAVYAGAISLDQAASVIVGASIGTTMTSALVTIGSTTSAKRTALAHILFNIVTGLIAIVLLPAYLFLLYKVARYLDFSPGAVSLALFHSLFILLGSVLFFPFIKQFAALIERLLPDKKDELTPNLDNSLLNMPALALDASQRTLISLTQQTLDIHQALISNDGPVPLPLLQQTHLALEKTFDFVTRIQVETSEKQLNQIQVAQLHAIDHLLRLTSRHHHFLEDEHHIHPLGFAEGLQVALEQLDLIQSGLQHQTPTDWVKKLKAQSKKLKELSNDARVSLLQSPSQSTSNRAILLETDNYRWLERNAHHIWRIGYYLEQAQQAQDN